MGRQAAAKSSVPVPLRVQLFPAEGSEARNGHDDPNEWLNALWTPDHVIAASIFLMSPKVRSAARCVSAISRCLRRHRWASGGEGPAAAAWGRGPICCWRHAQWNRTEQSSQQQRRPQELATITGTAGAGRRDRHTQMEPVQQRGTPAVWHRPTGGPEPASTGATRQLGQEGSRAGAFAAGAGAQRADALRAHAAGSWCSLNQSGRGGA